MRLCSRVLIFAAIATIPGSVFAGGLIQKLPKDGAWVTFHVNHHFDGVALAKGSGSFSVRSVGRTTTDGKKRQWIEFEENIDLSQSGFNKFQRWHKFLVADKGLQPGRDSLSHVARVWKKWNGEKALRLEGPPDYDDCVMYLPGVSRKNTVVSRKVTRVEKAKTFPWQRGELKCKSAVRETYKFTQKYDGIDIEFPTIFVFTLWKHDSVPFGVAGATIEHRRYNKQGKRLFTWTYELSLSDFGTKAKSALPKLR